MEGSLSAYYFRQGFRSAPIPLPVASPDAAKSQPPAAYVIGSAEGCDLVISDAGLDPQHLIFRWDWKFSTWTVENLSASLVSVESRPLPQRQSQPLLGWETSLKTQGIILEIHRTPDAPIYNEQPAWQVPLTAEGLMIGRGNKNKDGGNMPRLGLDQTMLAIGRNQTEIRRDGDGYVLINHNPNGVGRTILNGDQNFDQRKLELGDCIQIPNCEYYTFKFTGKSLRHLGQGGALKGIDVTVEVGRERILHSMNVELHKGSFLGIIGGSGQGKSTLMNALCGIVPPTGGAVFVDGVQLRSPRDVARAGVAYVPQDDIVHKELTVDEALSYAARLRLNASPSQIQELLETTMDTLRLTEHRHKRISHLSGGQRKRVSIASELLVSPDYLFLDEPTSGLDPQTERALMGELSLLARHKRIGVACTTHILQNCHVLTKIAFISRGRLIFQGKPVDAARFFIFAGSPEGAARLRLAASSDAAASDTGSGQLGLLPAGQEFSEADLLNKVANIYDIAHDPAKSVEEQERQAEAWCGEYRASPYFQAPQAEAADESRALPSLTKGVGVARSLGLLVGRQWKILTASRLNYLSLIAQPAVIGLLIAWLDENLVLQMFLALITTLWFGCSNGAQQIVAELPIFRRERLAGLGRHTYVASKFTFLSAITGFQALLLYGMLLVCSPLFHGEISSDLKDAKPDLSGHLPSRATREFREAFFDKTWDSLAAGDDSHKDALAETNVAPLVTTADGALDFDGTAGLAERNAPDKSRDAPLAQRIVYLNPAGLHIGDSEYKLMEKAARFFRIRENVLDRLAVRKVTVPPEQESVIKSQDGAVSWKRFVLTLVALRLGALLGAALVGVALGLSLSALVNTPTQAVMWVPLILIPQILFGSFIVVAPEMDDAVLHFSQILPSFNLQRVMDVGLVYGRTVPRMTNQTRIPAFLDAPERQEIVEWDGQQTKYDRLSEANKSWQNLVVLRKRVGAREKELFPESPHFKDSVEHRHDVQLGRGEPYVMVTTAVVGMAVLAGWVAICYGAAVLALARRQAKA